MKKSARVSEKLASPGFPGLQVARRLFVDQGTKRNAWGIVTLRTFIVIANTVAYHPFMFNAVLKSEVRLLVQLDRK